jgi:hypothetical protein
MEAPFLTAQTPIENSDSSEIEDPLPEGYSEALADCQALAVNLLQKALTGEDIKRCWDCNAWVGRCLKGRPNPIARSDACELFTPKSHRRGNDAF